MKNFILSLVTCSFSVFLALTSQASLTRPIQQLPVLEGGRVKPFETFARETLTLITGKSSFAGTPARDVVMTWLLAPDEWNEKKFILIDSPLVRKSLNVPENQKYFSPAEIEKILNLAPLFGDLATKREAKEKLNPYFQAVARLQSELVLYREWIAGRGAHLLPSLSAKEEVAPSVGHPTSPPMGSAVSPAHEKTWKTLSELKPAEEAQFLPIARAFSSALNGAEGSKEALNVAVDKWKSFVLAREGNAFDQNRLNAEIFYDEVMPFRWAWIFYFTTVVLLGLGWILRRSARFQRLSWLPLGAGVALHLVGFALRIYLTGRAPVANMYETVVWVGLGSLAFSLFIYRVYRWAFLPFAGALVAGFCLLLSDFAPAVLDSTLQPLEPVLRSNYWLTIHVLTITLSYAAFFLAFVLGDVGIILGLRAGQKNKIQKVLPQISLAVYRAIQVGVSLLGPGIILGGIWADYSWGRFWGWDPKETWALIVLLGYLAILHARMAGMLQQFGILISAVFAFNLVIMAWYGVNFVLGAGLHSYGFGAGGLEYVSFFVAAHLALCAYAFTSQKGNFKKSIDS